MDDAKTIVNVKNGVHKLSEDNSGLELLQETVLFSILKEIPFRQ